MVSKVTHGKVIALRTQIWATTMNAGVCKNRLGEAPDARQATASQAVYTRTHVVRGMMQPRAAAQMPVAGLREDDRSVSIARRALQYGIESR